MNQTPLFNYQSLSTPWAANAARRARAAASTSSKSKTIAVEKSPAGPVAAPANGLTRSPASSPAKPSDRRPDPRDGHSEFNLPDEDRVLRTLDMLRRCDSCGEHPALQRNRQGPRNLYRVGCSATLKKGLEFWDEDCPEPTPWLKSSSAAIGHWKLVQKLTRP